MDLQPQQLRALMSRLNTTRIAHRSQGKATLSYLEAWDIRATLIRIFGFGGFSITSDAQVYDVRDVPRSQGEGTNFSVTALATTRLVIHDTATGDMDKPAAMYTETAASTQTNPSLGEAMDFAIKTAVSDALKRCAINLGTQFGLGLYDNGSANEVIRMIFAPNQVWPPADSSAEGSTENVDAITDAQDEDQIAKATAFIENALGGKVVKEDAVADVTGAEELPDEPAEGTET